MRAFGKVYGNGELGGYKIPVLQKNFLTNLH